MEEVNNCTLLCYIPEAYREYYKERYHEVIILQIYLQAIKITKAKIKIADNSVFEQMDNIIFGYTADVIIENSIFRDINCTNDAFFLNTAGVTISNSRFENIHGKFNSHILLRAIIESPVYITDTVFDQIYMPLYLVRHLSLLDVRRSNFTNIQTTEETWVGQNLRAVAYFEDCIFENVNSVASYAF